MVDALVDMVVDTVIGAVVGTVVGRLDGTVVGRNLQVYLCWLVVLGGKLVCVLVSWFIPSLFVLPSFSFA